MPLRNAATQCRYAMGLPMALHIRICAEAPDPAKMILRSNKAADIQPGDGAGGRSDVGRRESGAISVFEFPATLNHGSKAVVFLVYSVLCARTER